MPRQPTTTAPRPKAVPKPRRPYLTAWRAEHVGQYYPSFVERWGVQRDDGAGPLSRLVSLCPDGVVGYTIIFDVETRDALDTTARPQRMEAVASLIEDMLAQVPEQHRMGNMIVRYGSGHGWHVHGLLDARAVPLLTFLDGWDSDVRPLETLDAVRKWAGYCVKHARKSRGPTRTWEKDIVAERLLRDAAECRAMGYSHAKLVRWFGLPTKSDWMTDQRWAAIRAIVAANRTPRPAFTPRLPHASEVVIVEPQMDQQEDAYPQSQQPA